MQAKIEKTEQNALKGNSKIVNKLELQFKNLEIGLETEQRRQTYATKNYSKADRRLREIQFQVIKFYSTLKFKSSGGRRTQKF